ncbi:hypothetical protein HYH03_008805 [Edaphochlamys debaryana]|uniref:Uncharacterized protein n=1 Tax=Edaphochlamys debaryana TaxID=47281 RepID=A0A835Y2H2_9CHLO|nr:hypothetical protein HYH03_008805 [Edaphochlamys debaryana]|eukprot:KAG2492891.1 hypothetical protein HYH03_008805 [Edaphochlamys debaryana]
MLGAKAAGAPGERLLLLLDLHALVHTASCSAADEASAEDSFCPSPSPCFSYTCGPGLELGPPPPSPSTPVTPRTPHTPLSPPSPGPSPLGFTHDSSDNLTSPRPTQAWLRPGVRRLLSAVQPHAYPVLLVRTRRACGGSGGGGGPSLSGGLSGSAPLASPSSLPSLSGSSFTAGLSGRSSCGGDLSLGGGCSSNSSSSSGGSADSDECEGGPAAGSELAAAALSSLDPDGQFFGGRVVLVHQGDGSDDGSGGSGHSGSGPRSPGQQAVVSDLAAIAAALPRLRLHCGPLAPPTASASCPATPSGGAALVPSDDAAIADVPYLPPRVAVVTTADRTAFGTLSGHVIECPPYSKVFGLYDDVLDTLANMLVKDLVTAISNVPAALRRMGLSHTKLQPSPVMQALRAKTAMRAAGITTGPAPSRGPAVPGASAHSAPLLDARRWLQQAAAAASPPLSRRGSGKPPRRSNSGPLGPSTHYDSPRDRRSAPACSASAALLAQAAAAAAGSQRRNSAPTSAAIAAAAAAANAAAAVNASRRVGASPSRTSRASPQPLLPSIPEQPLLELPDAHEPPLLSPAAASAPVTLTSSSLSSALSGSLGSPGTPPPPAAVRKLRWDKLPLPHNTARISPTEVVEAATMMRRLQALASGGSGSSRGSSPAARGNDLGLRPKSFPAAVKPHVTRFMSGTEPKGRATAECMAAAEPDCGGSGTPTSSSSARTPSSLSLAAASLAAATTRLMSKLLGSRRRRYRASVDAAADAAAPGAAADDAAVNADAAVAGVELSSSLSASFTPATERCSSCGGAGDWQAAAAAAAAVADLCLAPRAASALPACRTLGPSKTQTSPQSPSLPPHAPSAPTTPTAAAAAAAAATARRRQFQSGRAAAAAAQPITAEDIALAAEALRTASQVDELLLEAGLGARPGVAQPSRTLPRAPPSPEVVNTAKPLFESAAAAARRVSHPRLRPLVQEAVRRYLDTKRGPVEDCIEEILALAAQSAELGGLARGAAAPSLAGLETLAAAAAAAAGTEAR